ncbi:Hypothetical_protein [Hexamita inflata]|uniref:Hypothetical_protein n=1 Tax=Hexamita inflata TaxID=28002 RepID=A0AA86NS84_9EUKA|nr:Hypothetical protein HINF_LOCUS13197 [Hexamita inflata]CAI9966696.1 Hypothetical protein HINF_LOCUS54341 [Hexamita inflata]
MNITCAIYQFMSNIEAICPLAQQIHQINYVNSTNWNISSSSAINFQVNSPAKVQQYKNGRVFLLSNKSLVSYDQNGVLSLIYENITDFAVSSGDLYVLKHNNMHRVKSGNIISVKLFSESFHPQQLFGFKNYLIIFGQDITGFHFLYYEDFKLTSQIPLYSNVKITKQVGNIILFANGHFLNTTSFKIHRSERRYQELIQGELLIQQIVQRNEETEKKIKIGFAISAVLFSAVQFLDSIGTFNL